MVINRGDIFTVNFGLPTGNEVGFVRPAVVVQGNLFNRVSEFGTIVVIPLSSNTFKAKYEGNILLKRKEGNLPQASVALVSHITHVNKTQLKRKVGTLSPARTEEIINGLIRFIRFDG